MKKTIRFFLFAVVAIFIGSPSAHADIVKGRVVDAETKEPLPDASVTLTQKFDFGSSTTWGKADSLGVFIVLGTGTWKKETHPQLPVPVTTCPSDYLSFFSCRFVMS